MVKQLYYDFFREEKREIERKEQIADEKAKKYEGRNKLLHSFCKTNMNCDCIKVFILENTNQVLIWNGLHGALCKDENIDGIQKMIKSLKKDLVSMIDAEKTLNKMRYQSAKSRKQKEDSKPKIIQMQLNIDVR